MLNNLSFSSHEIKRQKWNHTCGVHRQRLWEKVKPLFGAGPWFETYFHPYSVVSLSLLFIFCEKSWSLLSHWAVEINRRWYMEKCLVPGLTHSGCSKDTNFPFFFLFIPHCVMARSVSALSNSVTLLILFIPILVVKGFHAFFFPPFCLHWFRGKSSWVEVEL